MYEIETIFLNHAVLYLSAGIQMYYVMESCCIVHCCL